MDLKTYLILTGMLSVSYITYKYISKPSVAILPLDLTQKISQQIKHQVMIVGISYSQAMRKIREDNKQKLKKSGEEIFMQFRNELSTIYTQKQNLILKKYSVSRDMYARSLDKFKNDKIINRNQVQVIDMLERAINGQDLDFTIPDEVRRIFKKQKILVIYKDMVALIGKLVMNKLQKEKKNNSNFDSANDDDFRKAIRELSIYDVKIKFLEEHGFKKSWGCPNEVFFKFFEAEKLKNAQYHKTATIYQKTYEKLIEVVSQDPDLLDEVKIDKMFQDCLNQPVKPKIQQIKPIQKIIPVQKKVQVRPPPQPKKHQNQDDYLEELMMQQLMNRSQPASNEEPLVMAKRIEQQEPIQVISSIKSEDIEQRQIQIAQSQEAEVINNDQQFNESTQEAVVLQTQELNEHEQKNEVLHPQIQQKEAEVVFGQQQKEQHNQPQEHNQEPHQQKQEAHFVLQEKEEQVDSAPQVPQVSQVPQVPQVPQVQLHQQNPVHQNQQKDQLHEDNAHHQNEKVHQQNHHQE